MGASACLAVIAWLLRSGRASRVLDQPNERSLHSTPIPRIGGLGIMAGVLPALLIAGMPWTVVGATAFLAAVSFADDRKGLPIAARFGAHFVAAGLLLPAVAAGTWPWIAVVAAAVAVVWMTNLYNFMDGSDGLAGGMALFGFGAQAAAAWMSGDAMLFTASIGIAAAAAAFLLFNFHPARVFMGDAGSIQLGFLAVSLGLLGWARGAWPLWFPAAAFGPFVADASVTLIRRMARGERFWEAHRSHYYQRLVQLGFGHRRTALAEYGLMALSALVALLAFRVDPAAQAIAAAALAAVYAAAGAWVDRRWRRFAAGRSRQETRA